MLRHDQIFKRLISTFFYEFLSLFFPKLARKIDRASIQAADKELIADKRSERAGVADIVMRAKVKGKDAFVVILVETQAQHQENFAKRMLYYVVGLERKYGLPVYPIALLTYDSPKQAQAGSYESIVLGKAVLSFSYEVVQLNRLRWQDFERRQNPLVGALMAKMRIAGKDRPEVEYKCLRSIVSFELTEEQMVILTDVKNAYLKLTEEEMKVYDSHLKKTDMKRREKLVDVRSCWELRALKQGREEGRAEEAVCMILRQLNKRFGEVDQRTSGRIRILEIERLEILAEELLDFQSFDDLRNWLDSNTQL